MQQLNRKLTLFENFIYLAIWVVILLVPLWDIRSNANSIGLNWEMVFRLWKITLPFLALFLINNYLLVPFLLFRNQWMYYLLSCAVLIGLVVTINIEYRPTAGRMGQPLPWEIQGEFKKPEFREWQWERPASAHPDSLRLKHPDFLAERSFRTHPKWNRTHHMRGQTPVRPIFMSPTFFDIMTALLLLGLNAALKFLFKSIRDERRRKELENQTFETELAYLKHQINPHFFMNTLNNIHALLDIDKEKAQQTVLELSKIMRYVLYESSLAAVPLEKEIRFMENYIALMKIRYTKQVDIQVKLPQQIPNVQVPPLLFISFLENAFKHGISYKKASFIHLYMEIKDDELHYLLINSKSDSQINEKGIGLENTKKRLQLLYNDRYTLEINNQEDDYRVLLIIPITL